MSDFTDALDSDKKKVFFNDEEFAEEVTYNPTIGANYTLNAIFDNEFESVDPDTLQPITSTEPIIRVDINDIVGGKVKDGDKVTIRTIEYRIIEDQQDGVGTTVLRLQKVPV